MSQRNLRCGPNPNHDRRTLLSAENLADARMRMVRDESITFLEGTFVGVVKVDQHHGSCLFAEGPFPGFSRPLGHPKAKQRVSLLRPWLGPQREETGVLVSPFVQWRTAWLRGAFDPLLWAKEGPGRRRQRFLIAFWFVFLGWGVGSG